ncbi:MAG: hypothetical protein ACK56F_27930, partial [bacterium]
SALAGGDQPHGDHLAAGKAHRAAAHIEQHVAVVALQQQALAAGGGPAGGIRGVNAHRIAAEAAEVAVVVQLLADAGAADLENIGLLEQIAGLECLAEHTAEG